MTPLEGVKVGETAGANKKPTRKGVCAKLKHSLAYPAETMRRVCPPHRAGKAGDSPVVYNLLATETLPPPVPDRARIGDTMKKSAMLVPFLMVALATLTSACGEKKVDSADTAKSGGGGGTDGGEPVGPPTVGVQLSGTGLALTVSGGPGGYWFGVAETGGTTNGWTGEDCVYGFTTEDQTAYSFCHDAGNTGTQLDKVGSFVEMAPGKTIFDNTFEGKLTYYLESDINYGGDGSCYVWGHDPEYYAAQGCTTLQ